jgi:CheY-like chemotaxis protein
LNEYLLEFNRSRQIKVNLAFETTDYHKLLQAALRICSREISAKNLTIQLVLEAIEHRIRADAARLQQIFWNLIQNAVKFTPPDGQITLRSKNPRSTWFRLEVIDSGIGITSDALPRIFDPFEQAGGAGFGGLGLGLSISKAIVELHGGKIFASSPGADHGAMFVIELPNVVSCPIERVFTTTDALIPSVSQKNVSNPRILLVDDHLDSIRPMQLFLEAIGYEVTTAHTVATALRAATQNQFDLLDSDIGLPDGT